jgi:RHS repeat-associated protein
VGKNRKSSDAQGPINRPLHGAQPMPNPPHATLLCRYHYDPLDRQSGCTLPQQPVIQRFHCDGRLTTEIQGAAQRSIMQHEDHLLAQRECHYAALQTHFLATDQQRSVLYLFDAVQRHPLAYTPYGYRPRQNGLLSILGFNGERLDALTGSYLLGNGYRAFNPVLMRFNSPDSWSPFGQGGLNAYGYCEGEPINRVDPNGHAFLKPLIKQMTNQLSALPSHPTNSLSKLTKNLLKTSKRELGGKSGIGKLVKESGIRAEEILLEHAFQKVEKSLNHQFSSSQSILKATLPPPYRSHNLDAIKLNISMFNDTLKELNKGGKQFLKPQTLERIIDLHTEIENQVRQITEQRVLPKYSMFPPPPPSYPIPAQDSLPPPYYGQIKIRRS